MAMITRKVPAISDAGLLFLKVAAFVLMIADHADWLLFDGAFYVHDTIGRVVFPAFAIVLAYNLHRVCELAHGWQIVGRMAAVGVLALGPYTFLQGNVLPLNVMFTLALGVACISLWRSGHTLAPALLGLVAGTFVDYAFFGVAAVFAAFYMLWRGWSLFCIGVVVAALVVPINLSAWALLVVPLLWFASTLQGPAPRLKWLFYVGYPVHLVALALLAATFAR